MASGKATPRQKMINMMYLVLTALLALNVSRDILNSFQLLADALKATGDQFSQKNHDLSVGIKKAIEEEEKKGNTKNKYLVAYVDELSKKADEAIAFVDQCIEGLFSDNVAGRDEETGLIKKPDETDRNMVYWGFAGHSGGRGDGKAKELSDKLNEFVEYANKFYDTKLKGKDEKTGKNFQKICIDPKDNKLLSEKVRNEHANESWEFYTFHAPAVANLAMLQKFKTDINIIEADLLEEIRRKLGEVPIKIDSLFAAHSDESKTVVAGSFFETDIYVASYAKDLKPKFSGSGSITLKENGNVARLKIPANASVADPKTKIGTQTWSATVTVQMASGEKVIPVKGEFKVALPVIDIQSANVLSLYAGCFNPLKVDVPALGAEYNPSYTVDGGTYEKISLKEVGLVPNPGTKKLILKVASSTGSGQIVQCGSKEFGVKPTPKPSIMIQDASGKEIVNGMSVPKPASFNVVCSSDKSFAEALPNEAKYKMTGVSAFSRSGFGSATDFVTGKTSNVGPNAKVSIPTTLAPLSPGSVVGVKVDKVYRVNYKGAEIPEAGLTASDLTRSFNIK